MLWELAPRRAPLPAPKAHNAMPVRLASNSSVPSSTAAAQQSTATHSTFPYSHLPAPEPPVRPHSSAQPSRTPTPTLSTFGAKSSRTTIPSASTPSPLPLSPRPAPAAAAAAAAAPSPCPGPGAASPCRLPPPAAAPIPRRGSGLGPRAPSWAPCCCPGWPPAASAPAATAPAPPAAPGTAPGASSTLTWGVTSSFSREHMIWVGSRCSSKEAWQDGGGGGRDDGGCHGRGNAHTNTCRAQVVRGAPRPLRTGAARLETKDTPGTLDASAELAAAS